MQQHKHLRFIQKRLHFLPLGSFSGSTGSPPLSLVSPAVLVERMALYIRRCYSFCLDYMHMAYNKYEDKLTTLYLQAS